jgi:DNA-binding NtrC family response regulator
VEIPGIIVTGESGPERQRDAARHGFGLMHKPVTPRQLHGAVERHLIDAD